MSDVLLSSSLPSFLNCVSLKQKLGWQTARAWDPPAVTLYLCSLLSSAMCMFVHVLFCLLLFCFVFNIGAGDLN